MVRRTRRPSARRWALVWLYGRSARPRLSAAGYVPVVADPGAQAAFWRAQPAADQAVGDWRNFGRSPKGGP